MKKLVLAAVLALAACGPANTKAPEAPAAPQALMDQVLAMPAENQPVFAFQQLVAYQQAHPEVVPPCAAVRDSESRGMIPEDVAPDSTYGPLKGALVYSVQCGVLRTATAYDPKEHWLVAFAPSAEAPTIVNCANARGDDTCPRAIPRAAPATPPATP